ncbi:adhesion G-protein coupled receptor G4-like [Watersipora subatra]|uniref:adhesion G-protein coupled receptor G4-like n=1 Tax=Watersipora subatra TaxID=2589382 RepID=UPI00355B5EA3
MTSVTYPSVTSHSMSTQRPTTSQPEETTAWLVNTLPSSATYSSSVVLATSSEPANTTPNYLSTSSESSNERNTSGHTLDSTSGKAGLSSSSSLETFESSSSPSPLTSEPVMSSVSLSADSSTAVNESTWDGVSLAATVISTAAETSDTSFYTTPLDTLTTQDVVSSTITENFTSATEMNTNPFSTDLVEGTTQFILSNETTDNIDQEATIPVTTHQTLSTEDMPSKSATTDKVTNYTTTFPPRTDSSASDTFEVTQSTLTTNSNSSTTLPSRTIRSSERTLGDTNTTWSSSLDPDIKWTSSMEFASSSTLAENKTRSFTTTESPLTLSITQGTEVISSTSSTNTNTATNANSIEPLTTFSLTDVSTNSVLTTGENNEISSTTESDIESTMNTNTHEETEVSMRHTSKFQSTITDLPTSFSQQPTSTKQPSTNFSTGMTTNSTQQSTSTPTPTSTIQPSTTIPMATNTAQASTSTTNRATKSSVTMSTTTSVTESATTAYGPPTTTISIANVTPTTVAPPTAPSSTQPTTLTNISSTQPYTETTMSLLQSTMAESTSTKQPPTTSAATTSSTASLTQLSTTTEKSSTSTTTSSTEQLMTTVHTKTIPTSDYSTVEEEADISKGQHRLIIKTNSRVTEFNTELQNYLNTLSTAEQEFTDVFYTRTEGREAPVRCVPIDTLSTQCFQDITIESQQQNALPPSSSDIMQMLNRDNDAMPSSLTGLQAFLPEAAICWIGNQNLSLGTSRPQPCTYLLDGHPVIYDQFCVVENREPQLGREDITVCPSQYTEQLEEMLEEVNENTASQILQNVSEIVIRTDNSTDNLISSHDVELVSNILRKTLEVAEPTVADREEYMNTFDSMQSVAEESLYAANQRDGSIEKLVKSIELFSDKVLNREQTGVVTLRKGTLTVHSEEIQQSRNTYTFTESLSDDGGQEVQVQLPGEITTLSQGDQSKRLKFVVYKSNRLFEVLVNDANTTDASVNSWIVSAQVGDRSIQGLKKPAIIVLSHTSQLTGNESSLCSYWEWKNHSWENEGITTEHVSELSTECRTNHLTNFALLLDVNRYDSVSDPIHSQILSYISFVGCGISLLGIVITMVTYLYHRKLRKDNPSKILLNLCSALGLLNLLFLSLTQFGDSIPCAVTGALLHYALLASFAWMAIEAFYMYIALVLVFSYIKRFILKVMLVGWGVPLIIVVVTLAQSRENYIYYQDQLCWLDTYPFYGAVLAPVGLVLIANTVAFILVVKQLRRVARRRGSTYSESHLEKKRNMSMQLRGAVAVFILLGLTWIMAAFTAIENNVVFSYLFTIFNSLQGFFLFIFYCVLKRDAQLSWMRVCPCFDYTGDYQSSTSNKHNGVSQTTNRTKAGSSRERKSDLSTHSGKPANDIKFSLNGKLHVTHNSQWSPFRRRRIYEVNNLKTSDVELKSSISTGSNPPSYYEVDEEEVHGDFKKLKMLWSTEGQTEGQTESQTEGQLKVKLKVKLKKLNKIRQSRVGRIKTRKRAEKREMELPAEYAYVMLVAVMIVIELFWFGFQPGSTAFQKGSLSINITSKAKNDVLNPAIDDSLKQASQQIIQQTSSNTAYQTVMQRYSLFVVMMCLGGMRHPIIAAFSGVVWAYNTADFMTRFSTTAGAAIEEKKRIWQYYAAEFIALGCTMSASVGLLGFA